MGRQEQRYNYCITGEFKKMNKLDKLRDYFLSCPLLKKYKDKETLLQINYLDFAPINYGIFALPSNKTPVIQFITGAGIYKMDFVLQGMDDFDFRDSEQTSENISFFEELEKWIKKNPPLIEDWETLTLNTHGYIDSISEATDRAVYQAQFSLLYYERR
jgi:hypothetical protein